MPPKKGKKGGGTKKGSGGASDDVKQEQKRIIDEIHSIADAEDKDIGDYPTNLEMAQKLVETENIEFTCLVERMQQINRRLEGDTANLLKVKAVEDYKIDGERLTLEQTRRRNMNARANHAVQKKECRENQEEAITTMRQQRTDNENQLDSLRAEFEPRLAAKRQKIAELQAEAADLKEFDQNKSVEEQRLQQWKDQVDNQQAMHTNLIEGIEKDRIKQIDKLRKDMLMQIRQVRMKNSVTNEDQLQGTTKLTVIQNMQLTAELDYQSKRTEDLMFKNHEMKSVITNLAKDLEDHKEVEKELAKRSHFCQKVIQKYKQQIEDLQTEITTNDQRMKQETKRAAQDTEQQDLMNYLNSRIQQIEQKLQMTQGHLNLQEEEYRGLLDKMVHIRNRYSKVILLLTEFIESFVEKDPTILQRQNDIFLDIDAVKDADDLRDVEPETLVALGLVLLKQLQPYVQDLSDVRHQENYNIKSAQGGETSVIHEIENMIPSTQGLQELENRPVHLKMREDENKLSFSKRINGTAGSSNYNTAGTRNPGGDEHMERASQPTRGSGINSNMDARFERASQIRSSVHSGNQKSGAFNSGLQNYVSTGHGSGMSKHNDEFSSPQSKVGREQFALPGVSRLPNVDMKQNFMHLRTNNRSGMNSLDRTAGRGGRRGEQMPNTVRKTSGVNYNSSSIPYLGKRGGHDSNMVQNAPGSRGQQRPVNINNYAPQAGAAVTTRPSGLPSVV